MIERKTLIFKKHRGKNGKHHQRDHFLNDL